MYFIGKTYGHIIDLFDNEEVTNQEIKKNLKFPSGTIKYSLKILRDRGWVILIKPGLHKLNYSMLNEAFKILMEKVKNEQGGKPSF